MSCTQGDIGAIAKLTAARTGNTLSTKATVIESTASLRFQSRIRQKRHKVPNKGDIDKVSQALQKMSHEDQTLKVVNDVENRQTLLYGIGDQQLEIIQSRLGNEYKCEIELSDPKIAFRETIKKKSDVEYKYKNSPADTDSMVMSRCALSRPAIWRKRICLSRKS